MSINSQLIELRSTKKRILDDKANLSAEAAKSGSKGKEYLLSLKSILNKLNEINERIVLESLDVQKYATFNTEEIGNILAELMSIYEGTYFEFKNISYKEIGYSFLDALLIIDSKKDKDARSRQEVVLPHFIPETNINILINNGYAIKFFDRLQRDEIPEKINFYEADENGNLNLKVRFRRFQYVKEFVDYVINYKIKNRQHDISVETLESLKNEFICNNIEQIQQYHSYLAEEKKKEFESSLEHDKKVNNRKLQKILTMQQK